MPARFPSLETERLRLTLPGSRAAEAVLDYYLRNKTHLSVWEPLRGPDFYTVPFWAKQLEAAQGECRRDVGTRFILAKRSEPERVIGVANLSNFVRGSFQACQLGYSLDAELQGQGLMNEALREVIRFAFEELELHRIMANYQPHNEQSARVLERLGFVREGQAKDYLYIDGAWRDHVLTAMVRPNQDTSPLGTRKAHRPHGGP